MSCVLIHIDLIISYGEVLFRFLEIKAPSFYNIVIISWLISLLNIHKNVSIQNNTQFNCLLWQNDYFWFGVDKTTILVIKGTWKPPDNSHSIFFFINILKVSRWALIKIPWTQVVLNIRLMISNVENMKMSLPEP